MAIYINASSMVSAQKTFGELKWTESVLLPENSILQISAPNYKEYIPAAKLRRMSRLVKFSLVSAFDCLNQLEDQQLDAIITATGLGCIDDTSVFLNQMHENKESLMNPTAFIRSTHNAVGGQIALHKGLRIPNLTYSQKETSFETALVDAFMMLENNEAKNVLLGGFDELTPLSVDLWKKMGCLSQAEAGNRDLLSPTDNGIVLGEAAGFFVLSLNPEKEKSTQLVDLEIVRNSNKDIRDLVNGFLNKNNLTESDIDLCILGLDGTYRTKDLLSFISSDFNASSVAGFKHLSGSFDTDTCFALWMAHNAILDGSIRKEAHLKGKNDRGINKVLLVNSSRSDSYSLMLISK